MIYYFSEHFPEAIQYLLYPHSAFDCRPECSLQTCFNKMTQQTKRQCACSRQTNWERVEACKKHANLSAFNCMLYTRTHLQNSDQHKHLQLFSFSVCLNMRVKMRRFFSTTAIITVLYCFTNFSSQGLN